MKLKSWMVAAAVVVLIFGGIGATMAFNLWKTSSSKEPAKYAKGEFAGQYNPGDIRGSYSFGDIRNSFDVPVNVLGEAFGIDKGEDLESFQVKELESIYENLEAEGLHIGTDSVRLFVAYYKDLPYTPEESTVMPKSAVFQLERLGTLSAGALDDLNNRMVDLSEVETGNPSAAVSGTGGSETGGVGEEGHDEGTEYMVRGQTTFGEILQWGVKKEDIEAVLGMKAGIPGAVIRDYAQQNELQFSTIKSKLQELVDRVK